MDEGTDGPREVTEPWDEIEVKEEPLNYHYTDALVILNDSTEKHGFVEENIETDSFVLGPKEKSVSNFFGSPPLSDIRAKEDMVLPDDGEDFCLTSSSEVKKGGEFAFVSPDIELPREFCFPVLLPSPSTALKDVAEKDPLLLPCEVSEASVRCAICNLLLESQDKLISHHYSVHSMQPANHDKTCPYCKTCNKWFPYTLAYNQHVRSVHLKFKCTICEDRFTSFEAVKQHEETHTHVCVICKESFMSLAKLDKPLLCKVCRGNSVNNTENSQKSPVFSTHVESLGNHGLHEHLKHKCKICSLRFISKRQLLSHRASTHSRYKSFCKICKRKFATADDLFNHNLRRHLTYTCYICDARLSSKEILEEHLEGHISYTCPTCSKSFESERQLSCHNCKNICDTKCSAEENLDKCTQTPNEYKCNTCCKSFETLRGLKSHSCISALKAVPKHSYCNTCKNRFRHKIDHWSHTCVSPSNHIQTNSCYCCKLCNTNFKCTITLANHICQNMVNVIDSCEENHAKKKQAYQWVVCKGCNTSFESEVELSSHKCKVDLFSRSFVLSRVDLKYLCHICSLKFDFLHDLKMHSLEHFPLKCLICNDSFKDLLCFSHQCSSNSATPVGECKVCGECFETANDFQIHYKLIHTRTTFKCSQCPRTLRSKPGLEVHKKMHARKGLNQHPFQCPYCSRTLKSKCGFEKHKSMHTLIAVNQNTEQCDNDKTIEEYDSIYSGVGTPKGSSTDGVMVMLIHGTEGRPMDPIVPMDKTTSDHVEIVCEVSRNDREILLVDLSTNVEIPVTQKTSDTDVEMIYDSTCSKLVTPMPKTGTQEREIPVDNSTHTDVEIVYDSIMHLDLETEVPVHIQTSGYLDNPAQETTQALPFKSAGTGIQVLHKTSQNNIEEPFGENSPSQDLDVENVGLNTLQNATTLQCTLCKAELSKEELQVHYKEHEALACTVCQLVFPSEERFQEHNDSHVMKYVCKFCLRPAEKLNRPTSDQEMFFCHVCQEHLEPNDVTKKHELQFHFKCPICSIYCVTAAELSNHRWDVHLKWRCRKCNIQCSTEDDYKGHRNTHHAFKCDFCSDVCNTLKDLLFHKTEKHMNHVCFCGLRYLNLTDLKLHQNTHSKCEICSKVLENEDALTLHETMEHPSKFKYACSLCGVLQVSKSKLESHMSEHKPPLLKIVDKDQSERLTNENRQNLLKHNSKLVKNGNIRLSKKKRRIFSEYECALCGLKLDTRANLKLHLDMHAAKYTCHICFSNLESQELLTEHQNTHHMGNFGEVCKIQLKTNEDNIKHESLHSHSKCEICGKIFENEDTLLSHESVEHPSKLKYSCDLCGIHVSQSKLESHMSQHKPRLLKSADIHQSRRQMIEFRCKLSKRISKLLKSGNARGSTNLSTKNRGVEFIEYECSFCGLKLNSRANLKVHLDIHVGKYKCHVCSWNLESQELLTDHQNTQHGTNFCKVCKMQLKTNEDLIKHDSLRPLLKCPFCPKSFTTCAELRYHGWNTHLKWKCDECGLKCKSKREHKNHIEDHLMKFKCMTCEQAFITNAELDEHEQEKHADPKCKICGVCLKSMRELKKHEMNHTKTTKCAMCVAIFSTISECREHVLREHF